jgi:hypothetical protein
MLIYCHVLLTFFSSKRHKLLQILWIQPTQPFQDYTLTMSIISEGVSKMVRYVYSLAVFALIKIIKFFLAITSFGAMGDSAYEVNIDTILKSLLFILA